MRQRSQKSGCSQEGFNGLTYTDKHEGVWCMTGGVFEEAIAIANLMLEGGQEIAQTVRTATFVDNTWKVNRSSVRLSSSVYHCMGHGQCQPLCPCLCHWLCHWVSLGCVVGYVVLCHPPGCVWLSLGARHLWESTDVEQHLVVATNCCTPQPMQPCHLHPILRL